MGVGNIGASKIRSVNTELGFEGLAGHEDGEADKGRPPR